MYLLHSLLPGTTPNLSWHIYIRIQCQKLRVFFVAYNILAVLQYRHTYKIEKELICTLLFIILSMAKKICTKRQSFDRRIHSTYRITNYWVYSISDKKENQKIKYLPTFTYLLCPQSTKIYFRQEVVINVYDMFLIF